MRAKREAKFELLRILGMLMVVMLHYISLSGSLALPGNAMTPVRVMGGFLESLSIVAVNVYVLISGYFLSKTTFRLSRIVCLWFEIFFYALLIPLILKALGFPIQGTDVWTFASYCLPISMNLYWFATAYFFMVLFSPLLNHGVDALPRKQLKGLILLLLVFFCFLKSISPVELVTDGKGYDFGWFLVLYLIAAYLRRYPVRITGKKRASLLVYLGSCFMIFLLYLVLHLVGERTGGLAYFQTVMFHYNFVFTLTGAIGLFEFVRCLKIREGKGADVICAVSPLTFGVYLIHNHVDLRNLWITGLGDLFGTAKDSDPLGFLLRALLACVLTFAVCAALDGVRKALFSGVEGLVRKKENA